ncbi:PspA/IM30 family protein [Aneurinibacillus sp. REN35]|uniref:PspA/IM30 family protein n=1 Tax=Aneurinibacillus sp. REN35 TaxID=3237286 RepID=UPI0035271310
MSIFKRIETITTAAIHQTLDQVENPAAMLNQYMRDMEAEIAQAEVAIARQVAQEKNWEMLIGETEQRIAKRERQAELAIAEGEETIARQAVADKQQCTARKETYEQLLSSSRQRTIELREQLQELKDKFYEMRSKKEALLSRARVAKTSQSMHTALHSIDTKSAAHGFARMEEKIMHMEADAEASRTLRFAYAPHSAPRSNLDDPSVEAELARLRAAHTKSTEVQPQEQTTP